MNNKHFPTYTVYVMWLLVMLLLIPSLYCLKLNFSLLLEWNLLSTITTQVMMTLVIDNTSLIYSTTVMFISANVLKFSTAYMSDDKFINRFTILVITFIISMNLLIFIPQMMILLLGWDGLGITSFILVIYYQNSKSLAAGLITAITNRIGDVALLLAIAWTMKQGHWNIMNMDTNSESIMQILAITMAAMTKSAQMPFSSWLPAAMAAPTPVSALVHSSTLVTAGVFLMIRFYPFLSSEPIFNKIMLFIAVSTMTMAGISATTECDMKKIIALSTLSQLGMMMTSIGLGFPQMTFIHMVIHALFKALLFICAGNFINSHSHAQDLRWMGNLSESMPITSSCMLIANTALCGFPFMAGFYSKDMIIEAASFFNYSWLMLMLIFISVSFTSFYSMRMSIITIWGPRLHKTTSTLDDNSTIIMPMLNMSTMSVFMGSAMIWMLPNFTQTMVLPTSLKLTTILMVMTGLVIGWMTSTSLKNNESYLMSTWMMHHASCLMWFLVPLSTQFMMKMPMYSSHMMLKLVDQSWLEMLGSQGVYKNIMNSSSVVLSSSSYKPEMYLSTPIMIMLMLSPLMLMTM
nr:NADH dehydrogenase subunit 5 [Nais communis]